MKRIKLLAAAVLAAGALVTFHAPVAAQTIGFKIGPSFSKIDSEDDIQQRTLTRFGGGGFVRFGMMGLSMQGELLAVTKGSKAPAGEDFDAELRLSYIEVPVLARFGLGSSSTLSPYVMVGPAFAFETSCKLVARSGTTSIKADCDSNEGDDFQTKKFDVGAAGVVGVELKAGPGNILVEGRYTHGLSNINDNPAPDDAKARNRSFAVMAGYSFTLNR